MELENLGKRNDGKARVLLAEDNVTQASVMMDYLEDNGHEVIHVEDATSVFSAVEKHSPDVILLARHISGIDGIHICRSLKNNSETSGIPIIMLTNQSTTSDKVVGLRAGADDYIPEPCDEEELSAVINARLRTKTEWDDLKKTTRQLREMLTRVETLANVDPLTGLFNRRRFETVIDKEFKRAVRYNLPLSCMMLDIDHFKKVNDSFGHAVGDGVLRQTVNIIQGNIRDVDTVARWGGEEFIIMSPNTSKNNALVVADRIRKNMAGQSFQNVDDRKITISIGIADIPDPGINTKEQLIDAADQALYGAKKSGRNRVRLNGSPGH
jgi:two-component system cell cycle response regulator